MRSGFFRVAVVGCGAISGNHLAGIAAAGQHVCALCDTVPAKARQRALEYGLSDVPVYTDYIEMLEAVRPDAVHICTPHDLHVPMAAEALRRNICVLCEKPLAITPKGLHTVCEAAKRSSATLGVCLQNRFRPTMKYLKEQAANGILGAAGQVVWKRTAAYYASGDWRGTFAREGGGVMINQALHTLDLLQWICGMPRYVTAMTANWHLPETEVEDTAVALFETADGIPLNFFATTAGGADLPVSLKVTTADGRRIHAENTFCTVDGRPAVLTDPPSRTMGKTVWGGEHIRLIAEFYRCLSAGIPFPIDAEEAGKVIRLILGMYASGGQKIPIPE